MLSRNTDIGPTDLSNVMLDRGPWKTAVQDIRPVEPKDDDDIESCCVAWYCIALHCIVLYYVILYYTIGTQKYAITPIDENKYPALTYTQPVKSVFRAQ